MKYIKIHMTVVKKIIIEPIVSARDHRTASVLREATPTVLPLHLGWVDYYIFIITQWGNSHLGSWGPEPSAGPAGVCVSFNFT